MCLAGYIGVRGCPGDVPESGLYINSLPGISLSSIEGIADSEQITFVGVWNDVETEAYVRFEIDFMEEVNKCHVLNAYCDYLEIICNNKSKLKSAWRYLLAEQLMEFRLFTERINRYTTIDLEMAKVLRVEYEGMYKEALKQAIKLIDFSDCCMDCGGNPEVVTWIP
jgi:hypothetical protein